MTFAVGGRAELAGFRVSGFDTVGSTNALALQAAREGDAGRHWFAALAQTEGRGRQGRNWSSQKGNLAASLLLVFDEPGDRSGLGFVAGVALIEAVTAIAPGIDAALKWPNDLLVTGKKTSGILLEAQSTGSGKQALALGIGVNVVAAPADLPYAATALAEHGFVLKAEDVFAALTDSFAEVHALWRDGEGLADVLTLWRRHAAGIGGPVAVDTPAGRLSGTFSALDDGGRLMLRDAAGNVHAVSAGDVYFGSVRSAPRSEQNI